MQLFDSGMDTIWAPEPPTDLAPPKENDSLTAAVVEELHGEIWSGRAESNRRLILGQGLRAVLGLSSRNRLHGTAYTYIR